MQTPKEKQELVIKLRLEGATYKQIQDEVGVCKNTIIKILKEQNMLKEPPKKELEKSYYKRTKEKLIEYKGGKCQVCGYNKCASALEFHHLDPSQKDFTISGGTKSFENLKPEVDKCILVCANCHREIHAGLVDLELLNLIL